MKNKFSLQWIASVQPRKQRKYRYNAPFHIRHKFLSAHLSKELRKKYGKRSLPLRKGDEVLVMRGNFAKKKAKVVSVNLQNTRVYLEGLQRTKRDGTKVSVNFKPHILQIVALFTEDKGRLNVLTRKTGTSAKLQPTSAPEQKNKESQSQQAAGYSLSRIKIQDSRGVKLGKRSKLRGMTPSLSNQKNSNQTTVKVKDK